MSAHEAEYVVRTCPDCGGAITTSDGRHPARCIRATCRYEGEGVPNDRESLVAFFKAHRPLPCATDYPDERRHWYACTCWRWASAKTTQSIEIRRTAPLSRRTYHCTGQVIHSHAEDDAADDDYEARLDREKRDVA